MSFWDTPTTVAVAGDWHMNTRYAVKAVEWAAEQGVDTIIHVGDFGFTFEPRFVQGLEGALKHAGIHLGFVDGNHDNHHLLAAIEDIKAEGFAQLSPHVTYLRRGFRWTWENREFLALGGAHSVDRPWRTIGKDWWPEETITTEDADYAIEGGHADVMITHDCPAGVDIPGIKGNPYGFPEAELRSSQQHRELLRTVVDAVKPRWLWHGHYHESYRSVLDLDGQRCVVNGLGHDGGSFDDNMDVFDFAEMAGMS